MKKENLTEKKKITKNIEVKNPGLLLTRKKGPII